MLMMPPQTALPLRRRAPLGGVVVLLCACGGGNTPRPCDSPLNCPPAAPICDPLSRQCRPCQSSSEDRDCKTINPTTPFCHTASGACVACRENGDCKEADRPICDAGICVGCRDSKECATDQRPICDPTTRLCRPCKDGGDDAQCKLHDGAKPLCLPGGTCGECRDKADCKDPAKMVCSGNKCVAGCETDANCVGKGKQPKCCNMACVDLADNKDHCGGCGKSCNKECCNALCIDLNTDDKNCGKCAMACAMGTSCCGGGCRDLQADVGHCGACGKACPMGQACCAANCADTNANTSHCGGCGKVCMPANATPACGAGKCAYSACAMGFGDCDQKVDTGCEANLNTDPLHCTACGKACAPANATGECKSGCAIKLCNAGFGDCDTMAGNGCEINLNTDADHCKMCGAKCNLPNAKPGCSGGTCTVAMCNVGFGDCDTMANNGCEVTTTGDANNCGACGKKCNFGVPCVSSVCTPDKVLIIGTDDDLNSDVAKKLMATGSFSGVERYNGAQSTPTVAKLKQYQAVLVYSSVLFDDAATLGNNLADYFDQGGRVVTAPLASTSSIPLAGRFAEEYLLVDQKGQEIALNDSLGTVVERDPLLTGVNSFAITGAARNSGNALKDDAVRKGITAVAFWKNNAMMGPRPLVVRGMVKGKPRVDLNFYPPSSDGFNTFWTGDGGILLRNALVYR